MTREVPYSTRVVIEDIVNGYGRSLDGRAEQEFITYWHTGAACRLSVMQNDFDEAAGLSVFLKGTFDAYKRTSHWTANYSMSLADDGSVSGRCSAFAISVDNDDRAFLFSGRYTDVFVERDGRWAFQSRRVDMSLMVDMATGVSTLLG